MVAGNPTACLLVIGNEVLSGRTQDANIRFIALKLGEIGIPLREVRVIPDVPATIIETVNATRAMFDFVFTTGGLHTSVRGEVLSLDGDPIPGLFAAGRTTSGVPAWGYCSGTSLGDATFFGRRAGQAAAAS